MYGLVQNALKEFKKIETEAEKEKENQKNSLKNWEKNKILKIVANV